MLWLRNEVKVLGEALAGKWHVRQPQAAAQRISKCTGLFCTSDHGC